MSIEDEALEQLALGPKRVTTDEGTVEERPIREVLEAIDHIRHQAAPTAVPWGLRIARTIPPGTC